jgi:hypothetical protein
MVNVLKSVHPSTPRFLPIVRIRPTPRGIVHQLPKLLTPLFRMTLCYNGGPYILFVLVMFTFRSSNYAVGAGLAIVKKGSQQRLSVIEATRHCFILADLTSRTGSHRSNKNQISYDAYLQCTLSRHGAGRQAGDLRPIHTTIHELLVSPTATPINSLILVLRPSFALAGVHCVCIVMYNGSRRGP